MPSMAQGTPTAPTASTTVSNLEAAHEVPSGETVAFVAHGTNGTTGHPANGDHNPAATPVPAPNPAPAHPLPMVASNAANEISPLLKGHLGFAQLRDDDPLE
ncbi:hypothetical protein RhiJN_06679 [Ceratobasidium sp. AG-Ba]|nr:hypothetical protein RhiJN_06679 [Ceratobasidium sp. AG-Ba]